MPEGFGEKVLGWALTMIVIVLFLGVPLWFACGGSPGLCERLCAPHLGVKSIEYIPTEGGGCPCKCRDGECLTVRPWTRPIAWLTDPAEE